MMAQTMACVICLTPVTNQSTLACCHQPCHASCATQWKKIRHTISCPYCRQDPHFVARVKHVWKDNRFWYGICYDEFGSKDGFWGELKDPYEPNRKTTYYLGYTKRQVIPRMKTCLSFL